MKRNPIFVGLALAGAVALVGCSQSSPTAPKQPTPTAYGISLSANPNVAGINESILLVAQLSGTVPDGTSVTFTTTIGLFENGKQEETRTTTGGRATATLVSLSGGDGTVTARVPNKSDSIGVHFRGGSVAQLAINSVQPNRGKPGGGEQVVIHGQGFLQPLDVNFVVNAVSYPAIVQSVAADGSSITVLTPQIPGSATSDRLADVQVTLRGVTSGGQPVSTTGKGLFTFSADTGIPLLYSVVPATGSAAGGEIIALTGKFFTEPFEVYFNFTDPSGAAKSLPGRTVDVQHGADGTDVAHIQVPRASTSTVSTPIFVDLQLKNGVGGASPQSATYPRAFVYTPDVTAPPAIFYISPTFGSVQGHETVVIYGANFVQPVTVQIGTVNEIVESVSSDGTMITIMTQPVPGPVPTAAQDVTVTTSLGVATLPAAFTYLEGQAPQLYVLTPNNGPNEGGTRVTITGVGFQYPVQVLFGAQQAQVVSTNYNQVVCISPSITPSHPPQITTVSVSVTNITSGKVSNGVPFQYGQAMFISGISPMQGPANAPTTVTITGQGFVAPVSVIFNSSPALQWSVLSVAGTQIVAKSIVLNPDRQCANNAATLKVTNLDSNISTTSTENFTYQGVQPLITSVVIDGAGNTVLQYQPVGTKVCANPWSAHTVTINGSGFSTSGVSVSFGGLAPVPLTSGNITANQITMVLPDLSGIHIQTTPCTSGTEQGVVNVATPVSVTVTNNDSSCADTLNAAVIITPCDTTTCQLRPTITTIAPTQGTMNGGTPVSIIGTNFTCPVTVLFGGAVASGVSCTPTLLTMPSPAVSGGTAGPVTVIVNPGPDQATTGYTYTAMLNGTANPAGTGTFGVANPQTNPTGTITANPTSPATFASWTVGPCTTCGTSASCTVTMTADPIACTATFNPGLTVNLAGNIAANSVQSTPSGINACTSSCSASFTYNNVVTLTVSGVSTGVWSGACSGTGNSVVLMDGNKSCTVTFP